MKLEDEGKLLRIFIGEQDKVDHKPLYEAIVLAAREKGLKGATVVRGLEGFGARSKVIHTAKILRLSEDLPIVIEIVDAEEIVTQFIPVVDALLERAKCGGLITMEKIHIIKYTPGEHSA